MKCLVFSIERSDQLKLFRTYVSRQSATKARAVLEGVELHTETINACFSSHPQDDEEAVQEGLTKWSSGEGSQPPTWGVLIEAMKYARVAQQHIEDLKEKLGLQGMLLTPVNSVCGSCVRACMCMRACMPL